jgi:hypothetical protein
MEKGMRGGGRVEWENEGDEKGRRRERRTRRED